MARKRNRTATTHKRQPQPAAERPKPDLRRCERLVMQLMEIPGRSGEEGQVAQAVVDQLRAAGAPASAVQFDAAHRRSPLGGEIGNLICKLPGTVRGPRRMLSAHLDTVPICVGSQPVRRGGRIVSTNPRAGAGADDRAGVAVVLGAALEILRQRLPHPPITLLFPVQEEVGLHGARALSVSRLGKPKLAFNWDGGPPGKMTIGATGGYRMVIDVTGVASHAGVAPEQGVSAIAVAALAIAELHREGWHGAIEKDGRSGTANVGVIRGGDATNVVTDRVTIRAEARSHDPVFRRRIVRRIERAFRDAARRVRNDRGKCGAARVEGHLDYESFLLRSDEPCVLAAAAAVRAVGLEPDLRVARGGLDANWLTQHGIPTVTLGCGQRDQHMVDESLDVADFHTACRIAMHLATQPRFA